MSPEPHHLLTEAMEPAPTSQDSLPSLCRTTPTLPGEAPYLMVLLDTPSTPASARVWTPSHTEDEEAPEEDLYQSQHPQPTTLCLDKDHSQQDHLFLSQH